MLNEVIMFEASSVPEDSTFVWHADSDCSQRSHSQHSTFLLSSEAGNVSKFTTCREICRQIPFFIPYKWICVTFHWVYESDGAGWYSLCSPDVVTSYNHQAGVELYTSNWRLNTVFLV